jgi:Flp pilus assembly protein TadG
MNQSTLNNTLKLEGLERRSRISKNRRGAIAVLAAVMMVIVLGVVAFAVDLGYLAMARTETQRTADATAHAAVIELSQSGDIDSLSDLAQDVASDFTSANPVLGTTAEVSRDIDVQVGRYEFGSGQTDLFFDDPTTFNAVKVRIRRTNDQNGAVRLFFAGVFNRYQQEIESEAIAALIRNVKGFKFPPSGKNLPMLPIVMDEDYWRQATNGGDDDGEADDEWSYDPETNSVSSASDGISEVTLFPNSTGSAGNLGTINIGVTNNSTSYISKQIRQGLSESDLDFHGGSIELNDQGRLYLSGNPGISASMQKALQSIVGQVRVIPIYRSVSGNGNNARFEIVEFVAVRIMAAQLSGGVKAIIVQPAAITLDGLIQGSSSGLSDGIFSSPRIVL